MDKTKILGYFIGVCICIVIGLIMYWLWGKYGAGIWAIICLLHWGRQLVINGGNNEQS